MTRPSHLLDSIVTIRTKLDVIEPLVQEAYEIVYSTRRIGSEKTTGGFTPDTTGERASCECEAETDADGNSAGPIIHVCASERYKSGARAVRAARVALTHAANDFQGIIYGSDHHKRGPFEHRDRARLRDSDHNPASSRATMEKAKRIAAEMADTFRRRMIESGLDRQAAAELADRMRRSVT